MKTLVEIITTVSKMDISQIAILAVVIGFIVIAIALAR